MVNGGWWMVDGKPDQPPRRKLSSYEMNVMISQQA
jgi:hypothetical protein